MSEEARDKAFVLAIAVVLLIAGIAGGDGTAILFSMMLCAMVIWG